MDLAIGAANALGLRDFSSPGLSPRLDERLYLHARDTSASGNDTVNMFIDSINSDFEYGASIVTAACYSTVYALQCTAAPSSDFVGSATCGPNAPVITVTSGPSTYYGTYAIATTTLGTEVTATILENCVLRGTTAATCSATITGTVEGTPISATTTAVATGSSYRRFDVKITGGSGLAATQTCSPSPTGAAARSNSKVVAIWALAGFIGVTSLLTIL